MKYMFPYAPTGFVWVYRRFVYIDIPARIIDAHDYGLEGFVVLERMIY